MIDLDAYDLSAEDRAAVTSLLAQVGVAPTLEGIWKAMDGAWRACGCDSATFDAERYAAFYRHPVWLLNGMFIEQDALSLQHRRSIGEYLSAANMSLVVDFGGGFGSLARMIARMAPGMHVEICDPFPPRHAVSSCGAYANISFVSGLPPARYDALVCTDVLEHLHDPLQTLAAMISSVRLGGQLLIANHFYPVIACHIPSTFHLRYSFDDFAERMGLRKRGPCVGSHAIIYERAAAVTLDWDEIRRAERWSRAVFPLREWRTTHLSWWEQRISRAVIEPSYYPLKAWRLLSRRNG